MDPIPAPPLPARIFRALFRRVRPRGYMRFGTWMARIFPSMQNVRVPLDAQTVVSLDLRKIEQQPMFLDGSVEFEHEERELLVALVPEAGVAIDVGANLGVFALTLSRLVGPNGLVLAYEPDSAGLLLNSSASRQIIVRPFAVSDREEQLFFRRERASTLARMVSASEARSADASLTCVTIDAEISRLRLARVDFLKIDVEGSEENVLLGAAALLRSSEPPVVFVEWIPKFRDRWKRGALAVLRELAGSEWRLFRIGWEQVPAEIRGFLEPDREANIVAFPPSRGEALARFLKQTRLS